MIGNKTFLLGLSSLLLASGLFGQSGLDIMKKVDARDDGDSMISTMHMVLIDKNKRQRIREIKTFTKDKGEDTQRIMFFLSPADVKNTAFLTYDYDEGAKDDDQWLYLPALKKTKRIPTSDKSGSFMGSDFSYSDMTQRDLNDYDFKLIKESKVRGKKVWIIESKPKSKRVIDETGYAKSVLFVREDNYVIVRGIHYLDKSTKKKYLDVKKMKKIKGIWVNEEMSMTTKEGKRTTHQTVLRFNDIKINEKLDDGIFTTRRLEKGL